MTTTFLLRFVGERADDVHRNRNFAEDLHYSMRRLGSGTTSDVDTMTTELEVILENRRSLGDFRRLLIHAIRDHLMEGDLEIEGPWRAAS